MEDGITTIDTGFGDRARFCAAYLVVDAGRAAFIDCGTGRSVPRMLAALDAAGVARADVDHLVLTHVHLDHAGGAGALLRELPNARVVLHPRGAPHMVDPAKLTASARQVYGDAEFERSYGALVPVPAGRVVEAVEGHVVDVGGRALRCIDAPGHARHHLAVWDARTRGWFTGDSFGLSYREFDTARGAMAIPTTSPVQFDPVEMRGTIERLLAAKPAHAWVTHYGRIDDVERIGGELLSLLDAMVAIAGDLAAGPDRHGRLVAALERLYVDHARGHGVAAAEARVPELLAADIELNAQGLEAWLARNARAAR